MSRAVQITQPGGPEQLKIADVTVGEPGPGEIRIRHHVVGLNFIDVYHRTGVYPLTLPATLGMEAAGVVEAVGEGVTHLKPDDRAASVNAARHTIDELAGALDRTLAALEPYLLQLRLAQQTRQFSRNA